VASDGGISSRCLAVLIADISGSTALYERLGDAAARTRIAAGLAAFERATQAHGGNVVKSLGDGVLCTFAHPADALHAALAMQDSTAETGLGIRVAAHQGEVIVDAGDVFGDAVNTTARLAAAAKPGETLLSRTLCDTLPEPAPCRLRPMPPISVPGKQAAIEVLAATREGRRQGMVWNSTLVALDVTATVTSAWLRVGERDYELMPGASLSLGRDLDCTIAVDSARTSRRHARVFHHGGKVYLLDESANGTWIATDGRSPVRVHREQALLHGRGRLHLGADPAVTPTPGIEYRCE